MGDGSCMKGTARAVPKGTNILDVTEYKERDTGRYWNKRNRVDKGIKRMRLRRRKEREWQGGGAGDGREQRWRRIGRWEAEVTVEGQVASPLLCHVSVPSVTCLLQFTVSPFCFHLYPLQSIFYIIVTKTFLNTYLILPHYNLLMTIEEPQLKTQTLRNCLTCFVG